MIDQVSVKMPVLRGVRQGGPISPNIFKATFQGVFKMQY